MLTKLEKKYWDKAQKAARFLQVVPFVRLIGVNGSLAQGKINARSDIDILIIAKSSRIWTCRFFSIILMKFAGLKTSKNRTAGQICLNRFITDKSLCIVPYDYYHARDHSSMVPIYDKNLYYKYKLENRWMKQYIKWPKITKRLIKESKALKKCRNFLEWFLSGSLGNWLENLAKKYQIKKIKNNSLIIPNKGIIIANDKTVCFHPISKSKLVIREID